MWMKLEQDIDLIYEIIIEAGQRNKKNALESAFLLLISAESHRRFCFCGTHLFCKYASVPQIFTFLSLLTLLFIKQQIYDLSITQIYKESI